ncbi:unnamed protein product [Camellia sinensis]
MSGLYNPNFSPARAVSPQIRSTPDVESNQYWSELLAEHQKIAPFMQVLPICNRLLNQADRNEENKQVNPVPAYLRWPLKRMKDFSNFSFYSMNHIYTVQYIK